MSTSTRRLELETLGKVTVASLRDERLVGEHVIHELGEELRGLVAERGRRNIVLNFGRVQALSAAALPVLLHLKNRLEATEGQLRLCCVHPELKQVFDLHRSRKSPPLFEIFDEEERALDSF
jgi:anti-sigma B factor antagonist